jgi:hypothetical protein
MASHHQFVTRSVTLVTLVFIAVALSACGQDRAASAPEQGAFDASRPVPAPEAPAGGVAGAAGRSLAVSAEAAKVAAPDEQLPTQRGVDSVAPGMIIRNGMVSIEVDSLEVAIAAVRQLATRLNGYVGNVSMSTGEYAVRSATLELKIPSARFEEAMTSLTPIGKVEQSNSTAEDVGEEFVDVTARMTNARRLEDRLVTLLATRTGKLEDVLAVERELARVRQEIERYEGRLRFLRSRVAMSTLSVTVHERAPLVSPTPGTSVIGEAFRDMWRNFVRFVAAFISSLGVLVPAAVLVGLGVAAWRRWRRRPPQPTPTA